MIIIKPLHHLNPEDIQRLNYGYDSPAKYVVSKREDHYSTVISLELVYLEQPYRKRWETDPDELEHLQQVAREGFSLGAYAGEEMVGIALAEKRAWNRSLWVFDFHVAHSYQGQSIGTRMMEALVELARAAGLRILICETQNTNVPAINFYRKAGFEIDGVDLSYYTNHDLRAGEVAIFMKRKIE